MIQRSMLNMVNSQARNKVKRLIKHGIQDKNTLFNRTMESVNKPQVQSMIKISGLEPLVVEGYVREIVKEELNKPHKSWITRFYEKIEEIYIGKAK